MTIQNEIQKFSSQISNAEILDVGCGDRQYEKYFLKKDNKYIGIDVEASGRLDKNKIADIYYDGINIPFKDNHFDVIICTQVLEHVENISALLIEFSRVLKKDGLLFLTVPFMWGEHEVPYDFRRFTSFGIHQILEQNFEVQKFVKVTQGSNALKVLLSSEMLHYANNNKVPLIGIKTFFIKGFFYISFKLLNKVYSLERIYLDNCVIAQKI